MSGVGVHRDPVRGSGAGESQRRALRVAVAVVGLAVIVWEVVCASVPVDSGWFVELDPPNLLLVAMVLVVTIVTARRSPRDSRIAWTVLALVVGSGALGDLAYSVLDTLGFSPVVSIADIVYMLGYPALFLALWWVARCRGGRSGVQATFDGLLLAAGLVLLVWELLTSALGIDQTGVDVETAVLLAYPFLDLLLLGAVVGVLLSSRRLDATILWICGYLVVVVVGDVVFLVGSVRNEAMIPWSSVLYAVGFLCLGLAATARSATGLAEPSADPVRIGRTRFLLLGASMTAPAITAGIVLARGQAVSVPLLLGSTAVIAVLVSWRVSDALRSERDARLASERAHFELWQQSRNDSLTGLGNRLALLEDLRLAEGALSVLFVDLDRFKQVNDTSGHAAGDAVLCEVTNRLQSVISSDERVYRLSGDEFVVVRAVVPTGTGGRDVEAGAARGVTEEALGAAAIEDLEARAREFVDVLERPYFPMGMEWHLTASVGCAVSTVRSREIETSEELLRRADIAMYQAKRSRDASVRVFDQEMQHALDEEHQAEIALRRAVAGSEFLPAVQPVVDLSDGTVVGFEALARWCRPDGSVAAASTFIGVAERCGLLPEIQVQVLDGALAFLHRWQQGGPERASTYLAVNASATELVVPGFVEALLGRLSDHGVGPGSIVVELTEGAMAAAPAVVASRLRHLRHLGIRIALDDFGTGYSSLSHLLDFPVDVVKIDRSFVEELTPELGSNSVVAATVRLAETLGLDVIAEGVETEEQLRLLAGIGVTHAQGYLLARPLLPDAAGDLPAQLPLVGRSTSVAD